MLEGLGSSFRWKEITLEIWCMNLQHFTYHSVLEFEKIFFCRKTEYTLELLGKIPTDIELDAKNYDKS